ncbi:uncharacterized protein LOC122538132 isoform X1 [Frieseomelitta varia]|uniref:uncharacterized protein LOC122538132 isoform X1 n=2 Tax=Frieseomelitta varia TaxID=561572 RepID=UPI001CB68D9D|nr:uncharacterized protein LOC122538132 isoform X1 [Frieseomelitta varia]
MKSKFLANCLQKPIKIQIMQSINILITGLSLLCFVRPLHSDPQGYSTNYESYNPRSPRASDPVHRVAEPHEWHDRFSISKSLPQHVAQHEETLTTTREENQFREPSLLLSYPEIASEGMYLQPKEYDRYGNLESRYREESSRRDGMNSEDEKREDEEELVRKMRILDQLLSEDSSGKDFDADVIGDIIIPEESKRVVREVKKKKPGLFWSLAKVTFQAINDTASAIKQITAIINNSIVPDSATASSITKESLTAANSTNVPSNGTETTTSTPTTTPAVLTRKTLEKLIRRNILGLVRVFNIEWKEALNQSETNVKEFQRDLGNQIGSFFRDKRDA